MVFPTLRDVVANVLAKGSLELALDIFVGICLSI